MSRFHVATFAFVFTLCGAVSAKASPLAPCIRATLSANGNAQVVNDLTFDDPDETHVRTIESSTFRVFRSYGHYGIRANGPGKYFADPFWEVVFTRVGKPPMIACPYALVTDDAQYLVLVGTEFAGVDVIRAALSIYHGRIMACARSGSVGPNGSVLVRRSSDVRFFAKSSRVRR